MLVYWTDPVLRDPHPCSSGRGCDLRGRGKPRQGWRSWQPVFSEALASIQLLSGPSSRAVFSAYLGVDRNCQYRIDLCKTETNVWGGKMRRGDKWEQRILLTASPWSRARDWHLGKTHELCPSLVLSPWHTAMCPIPAFAGTGHPRQDIFSHAFSFLCSFHPSGSSLVPVAMPWMFAQCLFNSFPSVPTAPQTHHTTHCSSVHSLSGPSLRA